MSRVNVLFPAWNRGLVSAKALRRVDLDRTKLSAEVMTNWLPSTQGSMALRPGTKYFGSSYSDTGAQFIEFVGSTDDVALPELTHNRMRIWLGSDAHALALLSRPKVDTTVTLSDTGWDDASTGGGSSVAAVDQIPAMTAATTNGVTVAASSEQASFPAWQAADDAAASEWRSTSVGPPHWWKVDFGSGNTKRVRTYTVRVANAAGQLDNAPTAWTLESNDVDTGAGWTVEDTRSGQTWSIGETKQFTDTGFTDTGANSRRYWRLNISALNGDSEAVLSEVQLLSDTGAAGSSDKVIFAAGGATLNAAAIGALAKATKGVIVSDTGTEHSLAIRVTRGPVTLRVGSTAGDDDYISETAIGTGYHNLAFTPTTNFHITLQSDATVARIVSSLTIGDSGTVEITTPWEAADLDNIRYDQSADVVYVDCDGVRPSKIERRGTGRSWSVVDYAPDNGPFLSAASSSAKFSVSHFYGNTTLSSDIPFFTPDHVGALVRIFHEGQGGQWALGAEGAKTDTIEVTGISDTGTANANSERRIVFSVAGTYAGRIVVKRSVDGKDLGFKPISGNLGGGAVTASDTGTFTKTIDDPDDNVKVWYRAEFGDTGPGTGYTSGTAIVTATYAGGGITGIARITGYTNNQSVQIEVLRRFSDTGPSDNWQQGYWSEARGFPTAVALHGGRLAHAQGGSMFLSVSDDFENFDDTVDGDAGPIVRTLGSGPVDSIQYLVSLLRLIIGTEGAELTLRSSSIDEPLTPDNSSAGAFSTQGSANLRAVRMDNRAIYVQRSRQRVFMVGAGTQGAAFGDYEGFELTLLVPDLLSAGVVSIAIQRQPDTRLHCVLANGKVGLLTYEPQEEVICWTLWETDGTVEKAMVLPGVGEDAVYYHIRRMIGDGNDQYTKALLQFEGVDGGTTILDGSVGGSSHSWTAAGNAHTDDDESKFGDASGVFDGTGDYVSTPDSSDFAFGSGDWTVDFRFNCIAGGGAGLCGQCDNTVSAASTSFLVQKSSGNVIVAQVAVGSTFFTVTGTTQFTGSVNTGWHHVAFVRSGSTLKLFIDGVQEGGDVAITGSVNDSASVLAVGTEGAYTAAPWNGWIDEFRLSVGIARWTSSFTPPTAPYGAIKRFLEKWAMESECQGDTGLTWLADCAVSYTDTGRATLLNGVATHLVGESVIAWGSLDTGSTPHVDLSPGYDSLQTTWTVDTGGDVQLTGLTEGVHHAVVGLPYTANWKSTKLAYGAQAGTALAQVKRVAQVAFVLHQSHNAGLRFGGDTGHLDPLPRMIDGATVDADHIFPTLDLGAVPFPGTHGTDERFHMRAQAPRPVTILGTVPSVQSNERV